MCWNKCDYCGQFISYKDFEEDKAVNKMITPESAVSVETYATYHIKCQIESVRKELERVKRLKQE